MRVWPSGKAIPVFSTPHQKVKSSIPVRIHFLVDLCRSMLQTRCGFESLLELPSSVAYFKISHKGLDQHAIRCLIRLGFTTLELTGDKPCRPNVDCNLTIEWS